MQATHSPERRSTSKKRSKPVKNGTFCRISVFFVVFFFPKNFPKFCFFFPRKRLHVTHSLEFQGRKKKTAPKKKTEFLLTHSIFPKKVQILIFSGEIKKYGTFDYRSRKTDFSENLVCVYFVSRYHIIQLILASYRDLIDQK